MENKFVNLKHVIEIFRLIKDKKIIIWGTGNMGKSIFNNMPFTVEFFIDNDLKKVGKVLSEKKVYGNEKVCEISNNEYIIIVASTFFELIKNQLDNNGLSENVNYIDGRVLYDFINIANNSKYNEELRKIFWDNSANEIYLKYGNSQHDYKILEKIIINNNVNKILDIGCGAGRLMKLYKEIKVKEVVGQDISKKAIDKCINSYPEYKFILDDIENLKFEKNSFDLIISNRVLSAVVPEKIQKVISKLCSMSKLIYINEFQEYDGKPNNEYFFLHNYVEMFKLSGYKIKEKGKLGQDEYFLFGN